MSLLYIRQRPCLITFLLYASIAFLIPGLSAQSLQVEIHQIDKLARQNSLQWQQFEQRLKYHRHGEYELTASLNPSIDYELEYLDDGTYSDYEHSLFLRKEFRTPSHIRNLRERRDNRIQMFGFEAEDAQNIWLADTRLGFVQIVLSQRKIELLEHLSERIIHLSDASQLRTGAGEVAALDDQLLQMSRYQIEARIDEIKLKTDRFISTWRTRMGFDEETELEFIGNFESLNHQLPEASELIALLEQSPRMNAFRQAVDIANLEESVARSSRIPSIEISAGYKQLNPDWKGFLFGVSIPLPVLNANTESIERARSLQRIESNSLDWALTEQNRLIFQLLHEQELYTQKLSRYPEHMENLDPFLNRLLLSYEEGSLSISDFLSTLNLLADTFQTRFNQLESYYSIITELEALTGQHFLHP